MNSTLKEPIQISDILLTSQPDNRRLQSGMSQSIQLFKTSKAVTTEYDIVVQPLEQRINTIEGKMNLMTEQMNSSNYLMRSFNSQVKSQNAVDSMLDESNIVKNKSFYSFNYK
jgi:hypothetical protein